MNQTTCFLIGHQDTPEEIYPVLAAQVERHIGEYGVREFFVGHYGGFDRLAAQAVAAAKHRHPQVRLTLLLPYHPAERPVALPKGFDGTYYPPGMEQVPRRVAIARANRYMVDHTDFLIAYGRYPASNTQKLLQYAAKRAGAGKLAVTNLWGAEGTR